MLCYIEWTFKHKTKCMGGSKTVILCLLLSCYTKLPTISFISKLMKSYKSYCNFARVKYMRPMKTLNYKEFMENNC